MTGYADTPSNDADSQPVPRDPRGILAGLEQARDLSVTAAADGFGQQVQVDARTVPGPGGVLRAPLSGAECVWYRSKVYRKQLPRREAPSYPFRPVPEIAPSDLPRDGVAEMSVGVVNRQALGEDRTSTAAFGVSDGQSTILIDPAVTDVDTTYFGVNRVVPVTPERTHLGPIPTGYGPLDPNELHVEWIIPVGAPVVALGTVGRNAQGRPALVPGPGPTLVSTKDRDRIASRARAELAPPAVSRTFIRAVVVTGVLVAVVIAVVVVLLIVP